MTEKSATLRINEQMQMYLHKGIPVTNLGFGEAGLPVLPALREIISSNSNQNAYPFVQGGEPVRNAVSGYFRRRDISAEPDLCMIAPGSKAILFALLASIDGDIILARPSWVSYAAQGRALGKQILWCDAPADAGGIPDPEVLPGLITKARGNGLDPRVMIITSPDNPSGSVASAARLKQLAQVAEDHNLLVISDEIYRDLAYDQDDFKSIAEYIPDRTVVTAGLSKSLALGGWRLGVARFPSTEKGVQLYAVVTGFASEVWSGTPIFMEPVIEYAFSEPEDVVDRISRSRRLHAAVSRRICQILVSAGASVRAPEGGFYLYPTFAGTDFAKRRGIHTDLELADELLTKHQIGVLPGQAFGDEPAKLGIRVVTSMLYGNSDTQRLETLYADDPLACLPIDSALQRIREAFLQ